MSSATNPAVVVERERVADVSSDGTIQRTVARMGRYAIDSAADPVLRSWAADSLRYAPADNEAGRAWGVWWLVKHRLHFANDVDSINRLFANAAPDSFELLTAPAVLVRMPDPSEDCDGYTMLIASLLRALGLDARFVTVACDPSDPARYSHIYPEAVFSDGSSMALDASHGEYPGWHVPAEHSFRVQRWGLDGVPLQGEKMYRPVGRRITRRSRPGLGACGDTLFDGTLDTSGCGVDQMPSVTPIVATTATPTASGSTSASIFTDISKIFAQASPLISEAIMKPGQYLVTGPNGQTIISNTGASPTGLNLSTSGGSSSLIMLALLGLGAVVVIAAMSKGRG